MRRLVFVLGVAALVAAACGDNNAQHRDDAGVGMIDAAPDGSPGRVLGCLDTPGVPAAATAELPCDLVPPGLQL